MQVAMLYDPDVFRAFLEIISLRALPEDIMVRPGFSEHVAKAAADRRPSRCPAPRAGTCCGRWPEPGGCVPGRPAG